MGRGPTQEFYRNLHEDYVEGTLTCLRPETIRRVVTGDFPRVMNIEPTNRCNLRCVYCPRTRARKGCGDMDWTLFQRLIDEAADHEPLIMLHLFKDGESFLHPRIIDMIRYAKKRKVAKTVRLNSNALSWSDAIIEGMLEAGLDDVTVSIDAADPATYYRHKGVDALVRVEKNIQRLLDRRAQLGLTRPFVRVKIMEFDGIDASEIRRFQGKWHGSADAVQVTGIHNWSGAIKGLTPTDEASPSRYPCVILWYSLVVNFNGEVTVCSVDWDTTINVGDVNTETLCRIWGGPKIKSVRRAHLEGRLQNYPVCRDCLVWVSSGDMTEWLKSQDHLYR